MRVLITTDTVGGVWTFSRELTIGLLDAGCSVFLVSVGRFPSPAQTPWIHEMQGRYPACFRFEAVSAPLEWESTNELALDAAAPALLRLAEDFDAEVLHSNQFCFGALGTRLPVIVTAHSDVLSWAEACRVGSLEDNRWLRCYKMLVGEGLRHAVAITAPTRWMLDMLFAQVAPQCFAILGSTSPQSPASLAEKGHVISNGRKITGQLERERRLQAVTVGRVWDQAKNVSLFAGIDAPMPLLVAGETSYEGSASVHKPGQECYLGFLSEQDLLQLFHESAIYVCTSRYEPFGLAPIEAALCGCAILANDLPSLREVWSDGALYFTDAWSLSELLNKLAGDPALLTRRQSTSIARARLYTREAMSSAYLMLYSRVVEQDAQALENLRVA